MIPKNKAPWLSRVWRRHPERLTRAMFDGGRAAAAPWLLMGLLIRNGYVSGEPVRADVPKVAAQARPEGKSILSRIKARVGSWFGR